MLTWIVFFGKSNCYIRIDLGGMKKKSSIAKPLKLKSNIPRGMLNELCLTQTTSLVFVAIPIRFLAQTLAPVATLSVASQGIEALDVSGHI